MAVAGAALLASGAPSRADGPIDLKVLYAGNPGSDRERDFKGCLEQHFARVATINYQKFRQKDAKGYDVVILDWTSIYPRDEHGTIAKTFTGLNSPTPPKLTRDFDRPTILIGAAGAQATRPLGLKINWL
jgi:hypothetical protein